MSQIPPEPRPTERPTVHRAAARKKPIDTERVPPPEGVPLMVQPEVPPFGPPEQSAARKGSRLQGASQGSSRNTTRQRAFAEWNMTQRAVPQRDPFPLIIGGIVGAALVGVVLIVLMLGGNSNSSGGTLPGSVGNGTGGATVPVVVNATTKPGGPTAESANLPGTKVPEESKKHVPESQAITYESYPPSSGSHFSATAPYGFSDKEIAEGKLVHSLEHGAIVLYYKPDLPQSVRDNLRQAYDKLTPAKYGKVKLVITPYSNAKMQTPISIVAWTRVLPLSGYSFEQIKAFYQALVDKGPEDVP